MVSTLRGRYYLVDQDREDGICRSFDPFSGLRLHKSATCCPSHFTPRDSPLVPFTREADGSKRRISMKGPGPVSDHRSWLNGPYSLDSSTPSISDDRSLFLRYVSLLRSLDESPGSQKQKPTHLKCTSSTLRFVGLFSGPLLIMTPSYTFDLLRVSNVPRTSVLNVGRCLLSRGICGPP